MSANYTQTSPMTYLVTQMLEKWIESKFRVYFLPFIILWIVTNHDIPYYFNSRARIHPREFVKVAVSLFDSVKDNTTIGYTFKQGPAFKVAMQQSRGWVSEGFRGSPDQRENEVVSFIDLMIAIIQQPFVNMNRVQ